MIDKNSSIFVAGHNGMVGSAVKKNLLDRGYKNIVTKSKSELNLTDQKATNLFFQNLNPDAVILCAAKVGGILANNNYKADFISDNLMIGANVIRASHQHNVKKLINLGSSCIYPKEAKIPIKEEDLLSGRLEPTNEPYAIAKIAALKMCESYYSQHDKNFYSLMPCNLYGPNDNFELSSSHVLPALMHKVHLAKINKSKNVVMWGTGKPLREFLYSEDLADAVTFCLENVNAKDIYTKGISHLNCGSSDEISILNLLKKIKKIIKYEGDIVFDKSKPDGTFRKKMDNGKIFDLGFFPKTSIDEGLKKTYNWFLANLEN